MATLATEESKFQASEIKLLNKIGKGAYGVIYMAIYKGKHVAVKRNLADCTNDLFASIRENDFASRNPRKPPHPYLVNLLSFGNAKQKTRGRELSPIREKEYRDDTVYMIFELGECNLLSYIGCSEPLDTKMLYLKIFMIHLLAGLDYYHYNGIAHRDLKPANCLIVKSTEGKVLKLSDFGMAKYVTVQDKATREISSASYRAPEVSRSVPSGLPADVWSLGCILYQMFTGCILFPCKNDEDEKFENLYKIQINVVNSGKVQSDMSLKSGVSKVTAEHIRIFDSHIGPKWDELVGLIVDCTKLNPEERPTVRQILANPMFSQIDGPIKE